MAASATVPQLSSPLNSSTDRPRSLTPIRGVVTLFGYGIVVRVERGHLVIEDGIGSARRQARFARVGHGLRRLIVIGSDGMVSLAALRWLADQKAAFVMLDRSGAVLAATGPTGTKDARLRRAQALAHHSGIALAIVRALMDKKLIAQERLARTGLNNPSAGDAIADARTRLHAENTIEAIRLCEAQAAIAYWTAWHEIPVSFVKKDLARVPHHWQIFGARRSLLTGSPRLAVNPPNAVLNYLYAMLEAEARLAAVALGLDPGLGFMHADTDARNSLACDLMEPIRPLVDGFVLTWLTRGPLRREWFFEERNGNCRLMGEFVAQMAATADLWARAVAPVAESVARMLWTTIRQRSIRLEPSTRLTQRIRREAHGGAAASPAPVRVPPRCQVCGKSLKSGRTLCIECSTAGAPERMIRAAEQGRIASQNAEAQSRRAEARRHNARAQREWNPRDQPPWLTEHFYVREIQSRLRNVTVPILSATLHVSKPYAAQIRSGQRRPHPRHWLSLGRLVKIAPPTGT